MWKRLQLRLNQSPFWIRLRSWEYWPMDLVYTPVYLYWLWLSLKARSLFFFTATNPGIETGGLYGDSKWNIQQLIPKEYLPKTLFVRPEDDHQSLMQRMAAAGISFPLIAKPDVGERGFFVEKIQSPEALTIYRKRLDANVLVQEFVALPEEVSVLHYRFPGAEQGRITSLTLKEFLHVMGDGHSTVKELITRYPRGRLQRETLEARNPELMGYVPKKGERVDLMPIGNHCRGTTFLDGTPHIDERLLATFDQISHRLEGIYFGRYDIKCQSLEDLKAGKNFFILEINGVKAEPTHIYQPGFSIWKAYRVLFRQWQVIFEIARANHQSGVPYLDARTAMQKFWAHQKFKKTRVLEERETAVS